VIVKVELIGLFVLLVAVNEGIGDVVPEDILNPIAELLVPLQEKEVPVPEFGELAVKLIELTEVPEQVNTFEIALATGLGLTVIV
jgi:hypothetical protein